MTDFGSSIKKTEEFEFAILGIPFDEKSCYMKGVSKGPQAIRAASTGEAINPWTETGVNLEEETNIVDWEISMYRVRFGMCLRKQKKRCGTS